MCRPAIAWATWDLIAMVEKSKHDGPATHAVTFVWIGHEVIKDFALTLYLFYFLLFSNYICFLAKLTPEMSFRHVDFMPLS